MIVFVCIECAKCVVWYLCSFDHPPSMRRCHCPLACRRLSRLLRLNDNKLSGSFPSELVGLDSVTSLDLSRNLLSHFPWSVKGLGALAYVHQHAHVSVVTVVLVEAGLAYAAPSVSGVCGW